jgi:hypothetical protein
MDNKMLIRTIIGEILDELDFKDIRRTQWTQILSEGRWIMVDRFTSSVNGKLNVKINEKFDKYINNGLQKEDRASLREEIRVKICDYYQDKMYEKISEELEKLEIKYKGNGKFNIVKDDKFYDVVFIESKMIFWTPANMSEMVYRGKIETKNNNVNNIFLKKVDSFLKKELNINVKIISIMSIITKVLIIKYKESYEYKLKNIYK